MTSKISAFLIVALASIAAAGIGGYLAVRESVPASASVSPAPASGQAVVGEDTANTPASDASLAPEVPASAEPPAAVAPAPVAETQVKATPARPSTPTPKRSRVPAPPAASPAPATSPRAPAAQVKAPAPTEAVPTTGVPAPAVEAPTSLPPAGEPEPLETGTQLEEIIVPAEAVVGLQVDRTINSDFARVEDRVDARVSRDVRVGGRVAVPAGARVQGTVVMVERGGKFKERARLGVRFHTILMPDGSRLSMETEPVFREGDSPSSESAKKVGGAAVGGAIIGAILGGGRGAAIGAATGAAGGTAAVAAGGRNPAQLTAGTTVTVRLSSPMSVVLERE